MTDKKMIGRLITIAGLAGILLVGIILLSTSYAMQNSKLGWILASSGVALITAGVLSVLERFLLLPQFVAKQVKDALYTTFSYTEGRIIDYLPRKEIMLTQLEKELKGAKDCFIASGIVLKSIESLLQRDGFWEILRSKGSSFNVTFVILAPALSNCYESIRTEIRSRGGGDVKIDSESIIELLRGKIQKHNITCSIKYFRNEIPWGFIAKVDNIIFYNPHFSFCPSPEVPVFRLDSKEGFGKIVNSDIEELVTKCPVL